MAMLPGIESDRRFPSRFTPVDLMREQIEAARFRGTGPLFFYGRTGRC